MQQQHETTISPDGQWAWVGNEWVPNTGASTGAPVAPVPVEKPKTKHLGMKITGGILGAMLILGIAMASLAESLQEPDEATSSTPIIVPAGEATVEADGNPLNNEAIPGSPANGIVYLEEEMPETGVDQDTDEYITLTDVKVVATTKTNEDGTGKYLASFIEEGSDGPRTYAVEWFADGAWYTTDNSLDGSVDQIPDSLKQRLLDEPIPYEISAED